MLLGVGETMAVTFTTVVTTVTATAPDTMTMAVPV
jgi:hypothetical protein